MGSLSFGKILSEALIVLQEKHGQFSSESEVKNKKEEKRIMLSGRDMRTAQLARVILTFFKLISAILYLIFVSDDEDNSFIIALICLLYKTGTF